MSKNIPLYHVVYTVLNSVQSISTHNATLAEQLYELNAKCPAYELVSLEECKGKECLLLKCPKRLGQQGKIEGIYVPKEEGIIIKK